MGTVIKEVAFLDLTDASEETLAEITAIKKVAMLIYNEKFEPFMAKIDFHEVAASIKVSGPFSMINGKLDVDHDFLSSLNEPMVYFINGKLTIKPDVTPDLINQAIGGIYLNGKLYCPDQLQGAIHQKIQQQNGKIVTYMAQATHLEPKDLTLTNTYLKSLDNQTSLAVIGTFKMEENLDRKLFDEKIKQIQFLSEALISEAFAEAIYEKLVEGSGKLSILSEGYTYLEGPFLLDSDVIERYNAAKLYVNGSVFIDESVSESMLRQHLSVIKTEKGVYARTELKKALLDLCDPTVKLTTYPGVLRIVDGQHTLTQPELDFTEGKLTYVIHGMLEIDNEVDPKTLFEKLDKVDLYGLITGTKTQCGVIQTKIRIKEGVIDSEEPTVGKTPDPSDAEEKPGTHVIARVSQLKL